MTEEPTKDSEEVPSAPGNSPPVNQVALQASADASNTAQAEMQKIPDDAVDDVPPGGPEDIKTKPLKDPPNTQGWKMTWAKVTFAKKLIVGCVGAYCILSVGQYLTQGSFKDPASIDRTMDFLKTVATIGLGYIFGRATDGDKRE